MLTWWHLELDIILSTRTMTGAEFKCSLCNILRVRPEMSKAVDLSIGVETGEKNVIK